MDGNMEKGWWFSAVAIVAELEEDDTATSCSCCCKARRCSICANFILSWSYDRIDVSMADEDDAGLLEYFEGFWKSGVFFLLSADDEDAVDLLKNASIISFKLLFSVKEKDVVDFLTARESSGREEKGTLSFLWDLVGDDDDWNLWNWRHEEHEKEGSREWWWKIPNLAVRRPVA